MKLYDYTLVPTCVCEDHPVTRCLTPEDAVKVMAGAFDATPEQESFWLILLNHRGIVKGRLMLTLGTQTACLAHPREVMRAVLLANATSFLCVHNHPGGDPAPSTHDVQITKMIRDAAKTMEIVFQDHLIIGDSTVDPAGKGFYSFRSAGII